MKKFLYLLILATIFFSLQTAQAQIRYVDASRPSSGPGTTWATAYKTLTEALTAAAGNTAITDIQVAAGTYYPTGLQTGTNRDASFTIFRGGLKLYGGYPAGGGTRNMATNPTILSGEINNTAITTDNSYHVLVIAGLSAGGDSVVVDGFSIQWGRASGSNSLLYNGVSVSRDDGGGMVVIDNANGSNTVFRNCSISGNYAADAGAGLCVSASVTFLTNCLFSGNYANYGGAIINGSASSLHITNCTIAGNHDNNGGGGMRNSGSNPIITNTIIYGNNGGISNNSSTPVVTYSLVQGLTATTNGNLNGNTTNPLFVAPVAAGTTNTGGNYRLQIASPCLNVGNNAVLPAGSQYDLDGNERKYGPSVDLGPFELQECPAAITPANPNATSPQRFCGTTTVANLAATGTTIKWYNVPSGGTALVSTTTLSTATYYVSQTVSGCESPRASVAVTKRLETTYYVKEGAVGDGSSWENASGDLQLIIDEACPNTQIWVAAGTYSPCRPMDNRSLIQTINSKNAFVLKESIKIFGGFDGAETDLLQRNLAENETILSGDLDSTTQYIGTYHVVVAAGNLTNATILDGFTITGGNATGFYYTAANGEGISDMMGGGIVVQSASPILANLQIKGNNSGSPGGGMLIWESSPIITNVVISGNTSANTAGGIYNAYSSPILTNVVISGNTSSGLACTNLTDEPVIKNSIIYGNGSGVTGGTPTFFNSLVQGRIGDSNGNINGSLNPLFINPLPSPAFSSVGNYRLQACSPAINAGNNASIPTGITIDLDGNPRIYNSGVVDMGAYEYQTTPGGPAPTATNPQSFCGIATVANLVATGTNIKWYNVSSGGTALASGTAISIGNYFASQTVAGCESLRTEVAVTIKTIPSAPTAATPQNFCGSTTVTNLATTTGTDIKWYLANTGGTALISTTSLSTRSYYASQTVSGCESPRTSVAVSVNAIPAAPTATSPQSFCGSATVANLATTTGTVIKWYLTSTGGTALISTTALATRSYYASQTVGGCESPRTEVTVDIAIVPIRYVKAGASGNGTSWADASGDLQLMINQACPYTEIWVAAGTFRPIRPASNVATIELNNRNNAFVLKADVKIFGGFPATGNPGITDRNWNANNTVLSGDIGLVGNNADNTFHVVVSAGNVGSALLDGFTITKGNTDGNNLSYIIVDGINVIFERGGGIALASSSPTIHNIVLVDNIGYAGAAIGMTASSPTIINVLMYNNLASFGTIYNNQSSLPIIINTTISGNSADNSDNNGVAMRSVLNSFPQLYNCIIWNNPQLNNSIRNVVNGSGSLPQYHTSLVEGSSNGWANFGTDGGSNVDVDPQFINPALGNYRLQACSPAINAGSNASMPAGNSTDLAGNPRTYNSGIVDMGAYEYQAALPEGLAITNDMANKTLNAGANKMIAQVSSCRIIARVTPQGASPVTGNLAAKVWVEATVPVHNYSPYVQRHYELVPASNPTISTASVTLYFTQAEFNAYNIAAMASLRFWVPDYETDDVGKAGLRVYTYGGTSSNASGMPTSYTGQHGVIDPDDNDIIWNASLQRWEVTFSTTGFGGFFVAGTNSGILPLRLLSFTGKLSVNGQSANLQWQVASQQHVKEYVVERSTDGISFASVGNMPANNLSSASYIYTDGSIQMLLTIQQSVYYRLRILDADGSATYSKVVSFSICNVPFTLLPNPARNQVWLHGGTAALGAMAVLTDLQGRVLQKNIITGWPQRINTSLLAAGVYFIRVKNQTLRLVIEK